MNQSINPSIDDKLVFLVGVKNTGMVFQEIIASHVVAEHLYKENMAVWFALGDLFNKAADLHHRAQIDAPGNPPGYIPSKTNYWLEAQAPGLGGIQEHVEVKLNLGHYHEMMDRAHCMQEMFELVVRSHPVSQLLPAEVTRVEETLGDLFQSASSLHHDQATAAEQKG